jgi:hypothetical protein
LPEVSLIERREFHATATVALVVFGGLFLFWGAVASVFRNGF